MFFVYTNYSALFYGAKFNLIFNKMTKFFKIAKVVYEVTFWLLCVSVCAFFIFSISYHIFFKSQLLLNALNILGYVSLVVIVIFILLAVVSKISNRYQNR